MLIEEDMKRAKNNGPPPHLVMDKLLRMINFNSPKVGDVGNQTDRTRMSFQGQYT